MPTPDYFPPRFSTDPVPDTWDITVNPSRATSDFQYREVSEHIYKALMEGAESFAITTQEDGSIQINGEGRFKK